MKPNNNHRWNRCRINEDYCLTFGHGEQFFHAFDKAFNVEVKYDTTKLHTSKSEISTNINATGTMHISEDMLGKVEGEPNKSPSNLVQEKPSDSISQSVINKADRVCPVECRRTAGIFLASHASARIFNTTTPNPRCALAHPLSAGRKGCRLAEIGLIKKPMDRNVQLTRTQLRIPADSNEEPASDFAPGVASYSTISLQSLHPKNGVLRHEVGASVPSDE